LLIFLLFAVLRAVASSNITIVILSFNEDELLQGCVESVLKSDVMANNTVRVVVSNTNKVPLAQRISFIMPKSVEVEDRRLQSSYAAGYLARYWNEAIIGGFESLTKPVRDKRFLSTVVN